MMSSITFKSAPGKVTEYKHSSPPLTRFIVKLKGEGRNFIPDRYRGSARGNANNQTLIFVVNSHLYINTWHCLGRLNPGNSHISTFKTKSLKKHNRAFKGTASDSVQLLHFRDATMETVHSCLDFTLKVYQHLLPRYTTLVVTVLTTWPQGCGKQTLQQA